MIDPLHYRVLSLSRRHRLGHLSSTLTCVGIIDEIYTLKRPQDVFVLSCGHAGLAHYVCLEKHEDKDANALYLKHRTHPSRDPADGIHVSSGSLGCGITIALGMAMADRTRDVYCLISDGESWEGAIGESLNLRRKLGLDNLKVYLNWNNHSCIEQVGYAPLIEAFCNRGDVRVRPTYGIYETYPFLRGVEGHYHQLKDEDWTWIEANR